MIAARGFDEDEALRLAASLERASEHPLAAAIVAEAARRSLALEDAARLRVGDRASACAGASVRGRWRSAMPR